MKLFITLILSLFMSSEIHNSGDLSAGNQGQKPLFTFGIIADAQYSDIEPAGNRFYRSSIDKLKEAITSFKENSVDFIINLGDLIEKDFSSFERVMNIINSPGIPVYNVPGNHDFSVEPGLKTKIPVLYSKDGYFSFNHEGFRFVFLDGNEISIYASDNKKKINKAKEYIDSMKKNSEINAIEWNGGISSRQLKWLGLQLDEAAAANEKVFILCHFPVFPDDVHNLLNYKEVLSLLGKKHNIVAWLNGHNHAGNYGIFNMTHFITFKGMVETKTDNSYGIVEVYEDEIQIKGYGREKSRRLKY